MKQYNLQGIAEWVQVIKNVTLPSFTRSVQRISALANAADVNLEHMATAIKRDPALATKIIRACSGVYRSRRGRINTVSRALVMLGVEEVRKISLTCALVDGLLEGEPPEEMIRELISAIQAATGARLFAMNRGDTHSEDVFIATLIRSIGPLAVWRAAPQIAERISQRVGECKDSPEEAEKAVLGFTYEQLSQRLAAEWGLADYIPDEKSEVERERCRASEIKLSSYLARAEHLGDEHPLILSLKERCMSYLLVSSETLESILLESSAETLKVAMSLGVPAGQFSDSELEEAEGDLIRIETELQTEESVVLPVERSESVIFQTLTELSDLLLRVEEPTLSVVKILEGMHKGIALDRVVFAMFNENRTELRARLMLGEDYLRLERKFHFQILHGDNIWKKIFNSQRSWWASRAPKDELREEDCEELFSVVGPGDFFVAPVIVAGMWVGCFYGDRRPTKRALHDEDFRTFNQLAMQANLAFSHFEQRNKQSSTQERSKRL